MKPESNLLIMRMITDRIGQQEVLLAINHNHFYFPPKKIHLEQLSPVETMYFVRHSSIL